ncbi:MAG TPA: NADPH:quinone oxidoreductase family protein [Azospirillaceae bacterium]|nr:NADPH:quinone oxidoreductase family protein [Azospirillaceae bacterium]
MKALVCREWGPPESLRIEDVPDPVPGPGQVRVRVMACGLNFLDTLIIQGKYQVRPPLPFSPGVEIAGVVDAVGPGVDQPRVGDRVAAMLQWGGLAELAVTDAAGTLPIPPGMDFDVAASFAVAYGTSHLALTHRANLKAGETLLVLGAAGGVGLTAVEIGRKLGARVIAAASSPEKLAVAKAHGADELIDYTREDLRERLKALGGADVVYDPVGGDLFEQALRGIKWEGRVLVVGFASGKIPQVAANLLLVKNASLVGVFWGAYRQQNPGVLMSGLGELIRWHAEGAIRPLVSATYPLARAADAITDLAGRRAVGKLVVTMT